MQPVPEGSPLSAQSCRTDQVFVPATVDVARAVLERGADVAGGDAGRVNGRGATVGKRVIRPLRPGVLDIVGKVEALQRIGGELPDGADEDGVPGAYGFRRGARVHCHDAS